MPKQQAGELLCSGGAEIDDAMRRRERQRGDDLRRIAGPARLMGAEPRRDSSAPWD